MTSNGISQGEIGWDHSLISATTMILSKSSLTKRAEVTVARGGMSKVTPPSFFEVPQSQSLLRQRIALIQCHDHSRELRRVVTR